MNGTTCDVAVVGGGPAGCFAAFHLARAGFSVVILEEHPTIGEPVDCSGIIGIETCRSLGLPPPPSVGDVRRVRVVSPGGHDVEYDPGAPIATIVDRAAFDRQIAGLAQSAGAEMRMRSRVTDLSVREDGTHIAIEGDGPLRSRAAILGCGPRYRFQHRLGMGAATEFIRTAQTIADGALVPETRILLGSAVAPRSFAWIVPCPGGGLTKIGVSARSDPRPGLELLLQGLRRDGLLKTTSPPRCWPIPIEPPARIFSDRVLAVGDAAGQTKPTTGGGLYYGLIGARLAAETLAEALRHDRLDSAFLSAYQERWNATMGNELKLAALFRRMFESLSDEEIDAAFRAVKEENLLPSLTPSAHFDWHAGLFLKMLSHRPLRRILWRGMPSPRTWWGLVPLSLLGFAPARPEWTQGQA